ncbi:MAG: PAS domain S-box protein [Methanolinea sp.]|jgi:PAS domain S-box-containing protein|nr:PAS domain S-box protein [Methanolinea sp.]
MRILLVDDDPMLPDLIQKFLEKEGEIEIEATRSGSEALEKISQEKFDAIVLDYELPGMNGIDLLRMIKRRGDDIPAIIFTGKSREEVAIRALNYGAEYYLQKKGDPRHNFLELLSMIREAVRKHRAGLELKESERRFRESLENARLIAFQLDRNLFVIFCNDYFLGIAGYRREDVSGRSFVELFVAEGERQKVQQMFFSAIREEPGSGYFTCSIRTEKAETRRIALNCSVLKDSSGNSVGITCIGQDITEKEKAEEEKAESEERLKVLFEYAPFPYFITDLKGTFLDGNHAAELLVGYSRRELIGRNFLESGLLSPEEVPKAIALLAKHIRGEATGPEEFTLIRKDGSLVVAEIRNQPVRVKGQTLVLGSVHDVTGRNAAEESLRRANAKLTLLNIITRHDILNTVTALLLYIELLKESPKDDAQKETISRIEMLAQTIKRQIEFTKVYQDIGMGNPQWQALGPIVERVKNSIPLPGVTVSHDTGGIEVYADPLLEHVIHNLIDNSLRHGNGVSSIWITTLQDEMGLKIVYEDNGQGIPPREKENIFKRGYGKNTGFGLFLAREILGTTGLQIKETGTYGKGARFEIRVPRGLFRISGKGEEEEGGGGSAPAETGSPET